MNTPAKGSVYSLEKCLNHDFSGLSVGAQNPPQMGMLYTHLKMAAMVHVYTVKDAKK